MIGHEALVDLVERAIRERGTMSDRVLAYVIVSMLVEVAGLRTVS